MQKQSTDYMTGDYFEVNVGPLNSALHDITKSIRHHASVLSKVEGLANEHRQIKKDLHLIRLDLSSQESLQILNNGNASSSRELPNPGTRSENGDADRSDSGNSSIDHLNGVDINPKQGRRGSFKVAKNVEQMSGSTITESKLSELKKDAIALKGIVRQLQEDLNYEIVQNTDMESRLENLNKAFITLECDHGIGGSVYSALQGQRELSQKKLDGLHQTIKDVESSIKAEVDSKQNQKLQEMKKWFNDLDTMVRNRQSQFNSKIASFAKSSEVVSLEENVNSELHDQIHRIHLLENTFIRHEDVVLRFQQLSSMQCFRKIHHLWKIRAMKRMWRKWHGYNNKIVQENGRVAHRMKTMRKLLVRTWFAQKARAWNKWQGFIERQHRIEAKRLLAIKLISNKVELAVVEPTRISFNRWRRNIVALKIHDVNMKSITAHDHNTASLPMNQVFESIISADRQSDQYNLSVLLESFNSDKDGAILILAQEINNIRTFDIKKVYRQMDSHIEQAKMYTEETSSLGLSRLETDMLTIERKSKDSFNEMSMQLPEIKSDIAEMRNSLHGAINRVKVIEQTHRDRIELLFEGKEAMEEEISTLGTKLNNSHKSIQSLQYDSNRCQSTVNILLQKMNDVESYLTSHTESIENEINQMKDQIGEINTHMRCCNAQTSKLNDSLIETKNDVIQGKIASSLGLKDVHEILNSHGVHKPQWRTIIENGGFYESHAKEKNYVTPINVISDGERDIDIPSTLASFAHDYAAWIAFEADHNALKLVVIGKNPDLCNSMEVETEDRRRILVER